MFYATLFECLNWKIHISKLLILDTHGTIYYTANLNIVHKNHNVNFSESCAALSVQYLVELILCGQQHIRETFF